MPRRLRWVALQRCREVLAERISEQKRAPLWGLPPRKPCCA